METRLRTKLRPGFLGLRKTACLIASSLLLNVTLAGYGFASSSNTGGKNSGADLYMGATHTVKNIGESLSLGWGLGYNPYVESLPGSKYIAPVLGTFGAAFLGLATFVTDPSINRLNDNANEVGSFASNQSWKLAGLFGYHKVPTGLAQVMPRSKKFPDGAVPFNRLTFDHYDEAKLHIQSTVRSIQQGEPLKNAIFYGDAGTGKSAVTRSFAHLKGFKVYSVSGHEMLLERSAPPKNKDSRFYDQYIKDLNKPSFQEITEWLKKASNKNNKIILDISEGDYLLNKIAMGGTPGVKPDFLNFFKQSYESSQQNFAIFISCNFNIGVGQSLKTISETSELDRRFKDRVNFKTPSAKVRMLLLKDSITNTIFDLSAKSSKQNRSLYFEANGFFDDLFLDRDLIKTDFIASTEGYSHDHMIKLGQKLVQVYAIARHDQLTGLDPRLNEFDYIDNTVTKPAEPIDQVLAVLRRPYGDYEWVMKKTEELLQKKQDDYIKQIPLLQKEAKLHALQRALQSGNYDIDDEGNPRKPQRDDMRGGYPEQYGRYSDPYGRADGW